MQPAVASLQLVLLVFAVPVHAGVYAPSLLKDNSKEPTEDKTIIAFVVRPPAGQGAKSSCKDDPTWVDADGDGCSAYASAINAGDITREVACGFQEASPADVIEGDFEGARSHCRATCGTCPAEPPAPAVQPAPSKGDDSCVDDPSWTDGDGDGCDAYASSIQSGAISQAQACGFEVVEGLFESGDPKGAALHCRVTCGTCATHAESELGRLTQQALLNVASQIVAESPHHDADAQYHLDIKVRSTQSSAEEDEFDSDSDETQCKDDPDWVDMDGDGCAVYAQFIASGHATQEMVCGRAHVTLISGNPSDAAKHCPVTCGNCDLHVFEDNDAEMKDLIRSLVEEESENILKFADLEEPDEKEDVPEATTTTTTAVKKLAEVEVPTNATWTEYCDPDAEEEKEELSHVDVLKMFAKSQPQQSGFHKRPMRVQKIAKPAVQRTGQ